MSDIDQIDEAMEINEFDDDFQEGDLDRKIKGEFLDEHEDLDYEQIDHLDNYDVNELDENEYSEMSFQDRLKAD